MRRVPSPRAPHLARHRRCCGEWKPDPPRAWLRLRRPKPGPNRPHRPRRHVHQCRRPLGQRRLRAGRRWPLRHPLRPFAAPSFRPCQRHLRSPSHDVPRAAPSIPTITSDPDVPIMNGATPGHFVKGWSSGRIASTGTLAGGPGIPERCRLGEPDSEVARPLATLRWRKRQGYCGAVEESYSAPGAGRTLRELLVADAAGWRTWLDDHHSNSPGVWLVLAKKGATNPTTLSYNEALDEAICFGWIDGQLGRRDATTFRRRFTPRSARSPWSQRNVAIAKRLSASGRMHRSGEDGVRQAKADGRWKAAYVGPAGGDISQDL